MQLRRLDLPNFKPDACLALWLIGLICGLGLSACGPLPLAPPTPTPLAPLALVNETTLWRYSLQTEAPNPAWHTQINFDDRQWPAAQLPLGTLRPVRAFISPAPITRTVYLRTTFVASAPALWRRLTLTLDYESGAAVYLNGTEIARANLAPEATPLDPALGLHAAPPERFDVTHALPLMKTGINLLALEVHSQEINPDLRAGVELHATWQAEAPHFVAGPVLGLIGADTVTVLAESDVAATALVEYYPANVMATTATFTPTASHRLNLIGLQPGTTYYYRLGLQTENGTRWSLPGQWTTSGGTEQAFRFAVWGDSYPTSGSAMPEAFTRLMTTLAQRGPFALGVTVGDNLQLAVGPTDGRTVRDRYLGYLNAAGPLLRQMPLYAALGNHDNPDCKTCLEGFQRYFAVPPQNNRTYYSFDYGPAHFVILNTRQGSGTIIRRLLDDQWAWLQADLFGNTQPVKFVFLHDEIFRGPGGEGQYTPEEQEQLHQLFKRTGVTAVFQGNEHYYDFSERDGLAYLITGGGGSALYDQPYNPYWSQHHALIVEVSPAEVRLEAVLPDGLTLDRRSLALHTNQSMTFGSSGVGTSISKFMPVFRPVP